VVHCKGGLGRAGTIAAKLFIELGHSPDDAVRRVRAARPGAIETPSQRDYVLAQRAVPERQPDRSAEATRDRAIGALVGLAVVDAVGTTLEFKARDSYAPLTDMIGGGPFHMKPGESTDDTSMALALADSLIADRELDPADLMERFCAWQEGGEYSCGCHDLGITVSGALNRWRTTGNVFADSTDPNTAGNGSLMRLAPVAVAHWNDHAKLVDVAARQSRTTHGAPEAISACIGYAEMLADAIAGKPRSDVMAPRQGGFPGKIAAIMAGSWRGRRRCEIQSSGYVAHSLEASLWVVGRTADFRSAVLLAANLGGDADSTAAITAQLAGALYGLAAIPTDWLGKQAWRDRIVDMAERLVGPTLN
jgi:ADP-ribosyl-[dinitrogen reductase] hydrolase